MAYPVIDLERTGRNIRTILSENNISVTEISEYLGINRSSVYKVLRGEAIFSTDNLFALSVFVGLSMNEIIVAS